MKTEETNACPQSQWRKTIFDVSEFLARNKEGVLSKMRINKSGVLRSLQICWISTYFPGNYFSLYNVEQIFKTFSKFGYGLLVLETSPTFGFSTRQILKFLKVFNIFRDFVYLLIEKSQNFNYRYKSETSRL